MRSSHHSPELTKPQLFDKASQLGSYLKTLSPKQIAKTMQVSPALASKTHTIISNWDTNPDNQSAAIDSFIGDIYSGLQADTFSIDDRHYAQKHLRILSGLYGILRPLDGVMPYRLEMAYKLPSPKFTNLYNFWGTSIVDTLPQGELIVNTSSVEYTRTITPYINPNNLITPTFLTLNPKTNQPTQVVVHTKIARGAFARWLITTKTTDPTQLDQFNLLNYHFDPTRSTLQNPTYICPTFGGIGLSMRLK